MTVDEARRQAAALLVAAARAEQEGRTELLESDLTAFALADDQARAELEDAIKHAGGDATDQE